MLKRLVIVDLEATCWDDGEVEPEPLEGCRYSGEAIEIGAVALDLQSWKEERDFQSFVRPAIHPELSSFCRKLTTIRQEDVDGAGGFVDVARLFAESMDLLGSPSETAWASWGAYDRKQMEDDFLKHGLPVPGWVDRYVNLKEVAVEVCGLSRRRRPSMNKLIKSLGLERVGTQHRGIDDARTYASVILAMQEKYGQEAMMSAIASRVNGHDQNGDSPEASLPRP